MRRLVAVALVVGVVGCGKLMGKPARDAAVQAETPPAAPAAATAGALATTGAPQAATAPEPAPAPPTAAAAAPAPVPASAAAASPPPPPSAPPAALTAPIVVPPGGPIATAIPSTSTPGGTTFDPRAIEEATGLTGATMADGVFRITKPRGDLKVTLDGFPVTPRMGLVGWVAFRPHPSGAMLVGVMPVAVDELQAVVSALANAGLEPTALHPHFVGEEPRITFVHFAGVGNTIALARGVRDMQDAIVRARAAKPMKAAVAEVVSDLDVARMQTLLGIRGEHDGGVYRITVPRADVRMTDLGVELGATMSPTSWAAFQGTSERAAVAGELMVTPSEVQPVIHALREGHIGVTGIHDNSSREDPRLVFVSFWGVGRSDTLAAGVRKALDQLPRGG